MNTLKALYFPGTEIYSGSQFPAFLLFKEIHVLQPVESIETADNSADIFKTSGLCQAHTPSPLGESRDRFLRLIRDIRERKDDYAAQLSSLTVAALSANKPSIDDTQQGIVTSLLGHHNVASEPEAEDDVLLWQARLVLKIAELLDSEEEEVAMQMACVDDEEENLFKTLQGEADEDDESLFAELQQLQEKLSRPTSSTIKNRLSAWSKLYFTSSGCESDIWLTHMVEAADILLEKYENIAQSPAPVIATFELPANIGWSREEAVSDIQRFQEGNNELLTNIAEAIATPSPEKLSSFSEAWSSALETYFPEKDTGRTTLLLYHFTERRCGQLLEKDSGSGAILAVVRIKE